MTGVACCGVRCRSESTMRSRPTSLIGTTFTLIHLLLVACFLRVWVAPIPYAASSPIPRAMPIDSGTGTLALQDNASVARPFHESH